MTQISTSEIDDPAINVGTETPVEPTEVGVDVDASEAGSNDMKKKELIELVVNRSGIKKKDAKPVIESMLAVLGETVAEGRELNLQPFGKLRINRAIEKPNGRITICKLRQSGPKPTDDAPLAEVAEEV